MQYAVSVKDEIGRIRLPNCTTDSVIQWHGLVLSAAHVFERKSHSLKVPLVHSEEDFPPFKVLLTVLLTRVKSLSPDLQVIADSFMNNLVPIHFSESQRKQAFHFREIISFLETYLTLHRS